MRTILVSSANTINEDLDGLCQYIDKEPKGVYVISITSSIHPYIDTYYVRSVLKLTFDDVESDDEFDDCHGIAKEDADAIVDFFVNTPDDAIIIVQCDGGISRSAGVAAALLHIDHGGEDFIFMNPLMCPNKLCFTTVLQSYHDHEVSRLMDKFKLNEHLNKTYRKYY